MSTVSDCRIWIIIFRLLSIESRVHLRLRTESLKFIEGIGVVIHCCIPIHCVIKLKLIIQLLKFIYDHNFLKIT
jgi:hypothetical protein